MILNFFSNWHFYFWISFVSIAYHCLIRVGVDNRGYCLIYNEMCFNKYTVVVGASYFEKRYKCPSIYIISLVWQTKKLFILPPLILIFILFLHDILAKLGQLILLNNRFCSRQLFWSRNMALLLICDIVSYRLCCFVLM